MYPNEFFKKLVALVVPLLVGGTFNEVAPCHISIRVLPLLY